VPVTTTAVAFVADTVSTEEAPAVIEPGVAVIVTVAAGTGTTVTVAVAVIFPVELVAVAVYVVVAAGVTAWLPPLGESV